jgi:hypothetical protein
MTFVGQAVVARPASGWIGNAVAEEAFSDERPGPEGRARKSAFIIDSVGNHVPVPIEPRYSLSCFTAAGVHWSGRSFKVIPDARSIHDPRGVADEISQDLGIGQTAINR